MRRRGRSDALAAVLLVASFGAPCSEASQQRLEPERYFADGVFVSTDMPEISIRFSEAFQYVGRTIFELEGEASVDRHHVLEVGQTGGVDRLVILHFEGFLPESDGTYNYRIPGAENRAGPDYRFSPELVRLGDHQYIHNTWFFDAHESIRANPSRELARTARLLEEHGYELPAELRMSRYVRVVDEERKHEFILFYFEPLEPTGFKAADFIAGGAGAAVFDSLSAGVTARSRQVFRMIRG